MSEKLDWNEIAIRIICRARSDKERDEWLTKADDAASRGAKTFKMPKHVTGKKP